MAEEMTAEEKAKLREDKRQIALKNLEAKHLTNVATAYLVNKSKNFGEAGDSAVENFLYFPSLSGDMKAYDFKTGNEFNILTDSILSSREEGERYSGNFSERQLMKKSAAIIQESLASVKVEDVLSIIGAGGDLKEKYKGKYVSDLDKESAGQIFGIYQTYNAQQKVSEALGMEASETKKGLVNLLTEAKKSE